MAIRWSLVFALVLALLIPTTALAKPAPKPIDAIASLRWVSLGATPGVDGSCRVQFDVTYTIARGSPRYLDYYMENVHIMYAWAAKLDRTGTISVTLDGRLTGDTGGVGLASAPVHAGVQITGPNYQPYSNDPETPSYPFGDSCPASGVLLGDWTAS